jgi:hypothetical protein
MPRSRIRTCRGPRYDARWIAEPELVDSTDAVLEDQVELLHRVNRRLVLMIVKSMTHRPGVAGAGSEQ